MAVRSIACCSTFCPVNTSGFEMSGQRTVQERIATLFLAKLNLDVPSVDTDLLEAGLLDSLSFVELLLQLEREFGIKISLDDLEIDHLCSIAKISEFVAKHK